ncbi:hypothetical protein RchiOBHm_Chr5g0079621 [Rosa chinensis]|uniref:Secreted protein n=1 Tax=Rosa chinensis TaxID=74649 RepID=A0A2P6QMK1_ROSCH|nr:hypothetical protein RchiOBHm_Chr5g0079621 [Rosa chinensis]
MFFLWLFCLHLALISIEPLRSLTAAPILSEKVFVDECLAFWDDDGGTTYAISVWPPCDLSRRQILVFVWLQFSLSLSTVSFLRRRASTVQMRSSGMSLDLTSFKRLWTRRAPTSSWDSLCLVTRTFAELLQNHNRYSML